MLSKYNIDGNLFGAGSEFQQELQLYIIYKTYGKVLNISNA